MQDKRHDVEVVGNVDTRNLNTLQNLFVEVDFAIIENIYMD